MRIRRSLLKDTVTVETYAGQGAYGPAYATAAIVPCYIDTTRRLVRDGSGAEVVSEATIYIEPSNETLFLPESRVLIHERLTSVLGISPATIRGKTALARVNLL